MQKSFWRLKFNVDTSGLQINAAKLVKLKKMYNNVRKYYELNMLRSFWMIGKHGKNLNDSFSRGGSEIMRPERHEEEIFSEVGDSRVEVSHAALDVMIHSNRSVAVSMAQRVFKRSLTRHIQRWQYNAQPEKRIEVLHNEYQSRSQEDYDYLSRLGAADVIRRLIIQAKYKSIAGGFKSITENMLSKKG